jgi:cytidine deaminase
MAPLALTPEQIATVQAARRASGGCVPPELVAELGAAGIPVERLMLDLVPVARSYAIPPISHFFVGAVGLGTGGALYFGANCEFSGEALSFTVHAEQAVVAAAMGFGECGIEKLAVSAPPCGPCRQFLYELTTASRLWILLPDTEATPLSRLLPGAFGPDDLGVTAALLSPQDHGLTLASGATLAADDPLVAAALRAANASYAPYSRSFSGVALRAKDGSLHSGSVAENAAFNPSLSPLAAALVHLVLNGDQKYADIRDAVLVEVAGAAASQVSAARAVLATITKIPLRVYTAAAGEE